MGDVDDVQPCILDSTYLLQGNLHSGNEPAFCRQGKHLRRQPYLPAEEVLISTPHGPISTR